MRARAAREWLVAGVVGRPHGLDGSFHVARARAQLLQEGARVRVDIDDEGTDRSLEHEIVRRAGTDERPIVRLDGASGRDAAEALRGRELLVPRAAAPPLDDDEYWAEDLEGAQVRDGEVAVGVVRRLLALPSCEVLEVQRTGAPDLLVPLVRDAVRAIDVPAGVIEVDLAFLGEEPA
jgi:16S rRNA processing protein RimM